MGNSTFEDQLISSVREIISISRNSKFKLLAIAQAQELARGIEKIFSPSEQRQIIAALRGDKNSSDISPRVQQQVDIIIEYTHLLKRKSAEFKNLEPEDLMTHFAETTDPELWKSARRIILAIVIFIFGNVALFIFGELVASKIWVSLSDKECQRKGYWYSDDNLDCHAWFLMPKSHRAK